jgi:hypothetical protein
VVEDELEDRRVAAERIDDRRKAEDEEEAHLACEQASADDAVPQDEHRRDCAGEKIVHGPVGPGPLS